MSAIGVRAALLAVRADPLRAGAAAIVHHPDGLLVVEDGILAGFGGWA